MAINLNLPTMMGTPYTTEADKLISDIRSFQAPNIPTPPPTIPKLTGFGDKLARIGGFGDEPGELKTKEELEKMTQAEIDAYVRQRKQARRLGASEALIQFGEALQGKPAAQNALAREQARKNIELQNQYQKDYENAIRMAEQTNPQQARLLRSLGLPGYINLQQKRAEEYFLGSGQKGYKPDLVEYKNTTNQPIKIGDIVIQPGRKMPINVAIPEYANAISGTSGLEAVKGGTVYTRQGAQFETNEGIFREILVGENQYFSGPGGRFTAEEFFAKYPEARTTTSAEGFRYIPDLKTFSKFNSDLVAIEKSMFQLENYYKNVKDANVGLARLGDQLSQWFKTLAGQQNLTPEELYRAVAEGRLQGLIGANRIDTVGGGVMTEKDAWRVIARLGGDVDSLQNPAVVGPLLKEMYQLKVFDYNQQIKNYNNAVETGNFKGYEKRNPISDEEIDRIFTILPPGIPAGSKKVVVQGITLYQNNGKYYKDLPDGRVEEIEID